MTQQYLQYMSINVFSIFLIMFSHLFSRNSVGAFEAAEEALAEVQEELKACKIDGREFRLSVPTSHVHAELSGFVLQMQIFWVVFCAWLGNLCLKALFVPFPSISIHFVFWFLSKTVSRTIPACHFAGCWNANMAVCKMKQLNFGLKQASGTLRARKLTHVLRGT